MSTSDILALVLAILLGLLLGGKVLIAAWAIRSARNCKRRPPVYVAPRLRPAAAEEEWP